MTDSITRPNILLITTDQQRTDTLSCYGSTFTHTPNLDRLAAEGTVFDRAYCCNPVCTPSRASIFSGLQVSRHGAWNVGTHVPEDMPLLSHRLAAQGYCTHYIGKAHFQPFGGSSVENRDNLHTGPFPYYGFETAELAMGHTAYGFGGHYGAWIREQVDEKTLERFQQRDGRRADHSWGGEAYDWELPTALHNSVWTADRTIEFLRRQDKNRPFFAAVGFQDPHHPHFVPEDYANRVDPCKVPTPDFDADELADKPPFFTAQRQGRIEESGALGSWSPSGKRPCQLSGQGYGGYLDVGDEEARLGRAYYYTMVQLIDDQVGRILNCLEQSSLAQHTLVIFTTDHGELLGDHGLWMKGPFHYQELVRVPLIVRGPESMSGAARCPGVVSHVDIAPTILAASGGEADGLDGVDLLPLLRGEKDSVRQEALIECIDAIDGLRLKTIVSADRKLTWYAERDFGELYDLEKDPREKVNLWDDPHYAAERMRLMGRLLDHLEQLERRGCRPRAERRIYA